MARPPRSPPSGGSCAPAVSSPPSRTERPKSSYRRFQAEQPNEMWAMDTTHWTLADGTDVESLNGLDDHSGQCLITTARRT